MKGLGLRAFNRETREWEHTWTDSLEPGHFHVWKGAFGDGKIDLFSEWIEAGGNPVRSRLASSQNHSRLRTLGELAVLRRREDLAAALGDRLPPASHP